MGDMVGTGCVVAIFNRVQTVFLPVKEPSTELVLPGLCLRSEWVTLSKSFS